MKTLDQSYKPLGLWSKHDFSICKYYWEKHGIENSEDIRIKNLIEIHEVLCAHNVVHWLQGKTLLGIFKFGELLNDHDDDLGVFLEDKEIIISSVSEALLERGFTLIRNDDNIISFQREYRYVDMCLFRRKSTKVGYANKWFNNRHFEEFDFVRWEGLDFEIPANSRGLLNSMYPKNKIAAKLRYVFQLFEKPNKLLKIRSIVANRIPLLFKIPASRLLVSKVLAPIVGVEVKVLSENQFLKLSIESNSSFNWKWRKRHLDLVTLEGFHRTLGGLVEYLSRPQTKDRIEELVQETDTSRPFFSPTNYDMRFWWGGNNYFWYCVKYQFKKNVVAYSEVNDYIEKIGQPYLFTNDYYDSLESMNDSEIELFLKNNPIEIENESIIGGKHRVFAMIGRLASGQQYIPITVIDWG